MVEPILRPTLSHLPRFLGLLLLVSALFVACNGGGEADTKQSVCDGTISRVQDLVAGVVNDLPGFAGCAPDPEHSGGYVVNVTSSGVDLEAVRAAIISHDAASAQVLGSANLRAVPIDTTDIGDWYQEAHNRLLLELPDEHKSDWRWWGGDLDEGHNQALFWYSNEEARAWAQQFILDKIDAPPGVIVALLGDPGGND
jgi:hypothetical protein